MSEPIEVLLKRLTAIKNAREGAKGFHFFCQIGSEDWPEGTLTLQISGTGWVLLSHRPQGQLDDAEDEIYSVYLATRDVRAFVRVLMEQPFWEFDVSRWEREEHETNIHIRLADTGKGFAWGAQFWSNELQRQTTIRSLMSTLNLIVKTVSDSNLHFNALLESAS